MTTTKQCEHKGCKNIARTGYMQCKLHIRKTPMPETDWRETFSPEMPFLLEHFTLAEVEEKNRKRLLEMKTLWSRIRNAWCSKCREIQCAEDLETFEVEFIESAEKQARDAKKTFCEMWGCLQHEHLHANSAKLRAKDDYLWSLFNDV